MWIVLLKRILISLDDVAGLHVAVAHDHGRVLHACGIVAEQRLKLVDTASPYWIPFIHCRLAHGSHPRPTLVDIRASHHALCVNHLIITLP